MPSCTPESQPVASRGSEDAENARTPCFAYPTPLTSVAGTPRLFAVLIGINEYDNIIGLDGAVSDVQAVKRYLLEDLRVPEGHIRTLLDHKATRAAIIQALRDLQADKRIKRGDPILIFYAGHGLECEAPSAWRTEGKIQCLLPRDCKRGKNTAGKDVIPDRTIGALIADIAKEKGDNITVIFDCCHSASGTRIDNYKPRTVKEVFDIPENLDRAIWGSRDGSVSMEHAYHGFQSHVLLAACGQEEFAYEDNDGGHFTKVLINILKTYAASGEDITYADICKLAHSKLRKFRQTPRCEGHNQHRVLFSAEEPVGRLLLYRAEAASTGQCVIHAGRAHGISSGVELTLYDQQKFAIDVIIVDQNSVDEFTTTIVSSRHLGNVAFAKLTCIGKLSLYLAPGGSRSMLEGLIRRTSAHASKIVKTVGEAQVMVGLENDRQAVFWILDSRLNRLGLRQIPHSVPLNRLVPALDAAAHYHWYLNHDSTNSSIAADRAVNVNLYPLQTDYDEWGESYYLPNGQGFCQKNPNWGSSNVIDFVVDQSPTACYGMEIKNNTPRDLFLNVFLFNTSSLSIVPYYAQKITGNPEAPLKKDGGTFTIGYGSGGVAPFIYSLEEGQDIDVGYLKIFFATQPIDMSDIERPSPFRNMDDLPPERKARESKTLGSERLAASLGYKDIWFTSLIPIIQRRR